MKISKMSEVGRSESFLLFTIKSFPVNSSRSRPVADKGDEFSIRRPARVGIVPITIGNWERVAALCRHHPQVLPLTAEIGAVDHARAVGGKIRAGFPAGFFVMNFARFGAGFRFHQPEAARALYATAIGDEENFLSVARPDGIDFHVVGAVIVAGQGTLCFAGEPHNIFQRAVCYIGNEDVEAPVILRGNPDDLFSVRRPPRLDIYGASAGKLRTFSRG